MAAHLLDLRSSLDSQVRAAVEAVNRHIDNIVALNRSISSAELGGQSANDLRDKRDRVVAEMSRLIPVKALDLGDGSVRITMGGRLIVDRVVSQKLETDTVSTSYGLSTLIKFEGGDETLSIASGGIGGLLTIKDEWVTRYLTQLDSLAGTLVQGVNGLHKAGFDLNGATSISFFDPDGLNSGSIALSPAVSADLRKIAAAGGTGGVSNGPGDNSTARAIALLRDQPLLNGATATYEEFFGVLLSEVGFDGQEAAQMREAQQELVTQLKNLRDAAIGVSIDEELAEMIRFQNSYAAAARLVTTVNRMMDEVLGMLQ